MPFTDEIIDRAWRRSGGDCECTLTNHAHRGRCGKPLKKESRGERDGPFGWEAHSISGQYRNLAIDCEIYCRDCYKSTL